jgi:D-inositol-3-phosphate glycosyltransferase
VNIYGASPGKVQVIPAGVDTNLFYPADEQTARRKLGLGGGRIILFAGRVEPIKGIDVLLRAVALLGNEEGSRLIIVGGDLEGSDEVLRLRSLACELGIVDRVIFWGAVEQEKMPLFYNAANVCVIPSLHESFCLVALEAMACGTPVVASRVGGLMTTIRDGETGFLVREHSPAAFAGYLALILNNRILEKALGEAGRASVQEYQWSGIAGKVFDVYQQVTQTRCQAD